MTWKKITLTDAIVDDIALYLGREYLIPGRPEVTTYPPRADTMDAWRIITAVLSHPAAAGLFADEDAIRAAREQGWDDAADWVKRREAWTDEELRAANPHRAAQELPTASCTVIVPADGRESVEALANVVWYANEAVLGPDNRWHGVWRASTGRVSISSVSPGEITPGTWKVGNR